MKNETNNKKIKEQENKTSERVKGYKVITREELIERVNQYKSKVRYYFNISRMALFSTNDETYDYMEDLTGNLRLIPGSIIHFDGVGPNSSYKKELERMMYEIKSNDVVVLFKPKDILSQIGFEEFLKSLTTLLSSSVKLCTIDFDNKGFVEIDIKLLILRLLTERIGESWKSLSEYEETFYDFSEKYYDSKL